MWSILAWIIVGGAAGWLASLVVKGGGMGIVMDIIVGIVGAIIVACCFPCYCPAHSRSPASTLPA